MARVEQAPGVGVEELHGEVDALQAAARSVAQEVVGLGGAGADHHRVELPRQIVPGQVPAHLHPGLEDDPLGLHLLQAPPDDLLLVELHVGNAVHEQSAGPVRTFIDRDPMSGAVELGGARQARGAGADDRHALAGPLRRRFRPDPPLLETPIDDGALDGLDGHRAVVDAQDARALAGRRTDAAGELGEVVGPVQPGQGFLPVVPIHQVVPVRYEVVQRTARRARAFPHGRAGMAEGDAAVHAAGALLPQRFRRHGKHELVPVLQTFEGVPVRGPAPLVFHESRDLAHMPGVVPCPWALDRRAPPAHAGADAAVPAGRSRPASADSASRAAISCKARR